MYRRRQMPGLQRERAVVSDTRVRPAHAHRCGEENSALVDLPARAARGRARHRVRGLQLELSTGLGAAKILWTWPSGDRRGSKIL
jgi:hypothetical protein